MAAFLLLALLFIVLTVAGLAGWCVDSRDARFSVWPLNRGDPNDPPARDAKRLSAGQSPNPAGEPVIPPKHHESRAVAYHPGQLRDGSVHPVHQTTSTGTHCAMELHRLARPGKADQS
jgi:hypothetical protein